ncbi:MAG: superinfection immunity protein [Deltaproteobacteria bacterium]|jgi:hypothetical protein|nr:superinfection immunity protein [Deltaproteobacteria bacterium]
MIALILSGLAILIGGIIGLGIYLIPTFIAFSRRARHRIIILILNIILGWVYGVPWIAVLIWALLDDTD